MRTLLESNGCSRCSGTEKTIVPALPRGGAPLDRAVATIERPLRARSRCSLSMRSSWLLPSRPSLHKGQTFSLEEHSTQNTCLWLQGNTSRRLNGLVSHLEECLRRFEDTTRSFENGSKQTAHSSVSSLASLFSLWVRSCMWWLSVRLLLSVYLAPT